MIFHDSISSNDGIVEVESKIILLTSKTKSPQYDNPVEFIL